MMTTFKPTIASPVSATALWTYPVAGDFTFLDSNFAGIATAGAPRWKP